MKRTHHEEHENHERWLVSYADFITLLFAFFTVLYATSQQDTTKAKEFEESIRKYLSGLMSAGGGEIAGPGGSQAGTPHTRQILESPIQPLPDVRGSVVAVESYIADYLQKNVPKEEDQKKLIAQISPEVAGVRIRLPESASFSSGSIAISPKLKDVLRALAPMLRDSGRLIQVEGYGWDERGANLPTVWEISALRATQVVRYLIEVLKVPSQQISAKGIGAKALPQSTNTAAYRRVEIQLLTSEVGEAD